MALTVDELIKIAAGVAAIVKEYSLDVAEVTPDGAVRITKSIHAPLVGPPRASQADDDDEDDLYRSAD